MPHITFLLCDQMLATGLTLPIEQLKAAEIFAKTSNHKRVSPDPMAIMLVSVDGAPIKTQTGLTLIPDGSIEDVPQTDLIYLPALWRNPEPIVRRNKAVIPWLNQMFSQDSVLASVGTGCWFLARAGLLNEKPATTHWHFFDTFQKTFPQVQLKRQHFITRAGNIYCTGSINSLADLTIYFIQQFFNKPIGNLVERHFFHELRATFETSRSFQETNNAHPDEEIVQTQFWLRHNYGKEINLASLAHEFGMSVRTFNRRFKGATNQTPLEYLRGIRLDSAKDLLQSTNISINEISFRSGYQDATHFSRLFKQKHGVTPTQYRTTVRAKLFTPTT